ncbi:hypothetical protein ACN2C7_03480 [Caulobacter sp. ErkDOM-E]|uniref:hypothetical protein n=1 Tax=Caulobacter sp. ErkDOM-E TaxID=3402778 RepID=UPI003AF65699
MSKLSVLSPFKPLLTEQEASTAARAGAVGAFLSVASAVQGLVELYLTRDKMFVAMAGVPKPPAKDSQISAAMMDTIQTGVFGFALGMVALVGVAYLVFGVIQWRRRTMLIPLIMFLFSAYSVLMSVLGLFTPHAAMATPVWRTVLELALEIVLLTLFWAGYRGGRYLRRGAPSAA